MINQQQQESFIDKEHIEHLTALNDFFDEEIKDKIIHSVSNFLNKNIDSNIDSNRTIAVLLESKIFSKIHGTTQVKDQLINNLSLEENIIYSLVQMKEQIQTINKKNISTEKEKLIIDRSNKYINSILKELHFSFLDNEGKNIYGDTDLVITDHINGIRANYKNRDITDTEKEEIKDFLIKTHKLFIDFFSNSVKQSFIDNNSSYKDLFMYFLGEDYKDYEFFLNSVKEVLLETLKGKFDKIYINKNSIIRYETEYKDIFNKEIDVIKEQYPQIKISQKRLEQIYNISTALSSSELYPKIIKSYGEIIEKIEKEIIQYRDKFTSKQHFLRSYYIEIFYYFYSYLLHDFCKEQYKEFIAATLKKELSTKIGDAQKQQEKERKRKEEQSKKAEDQVQQPKKQEEPKNLLLPEDLENIDFIKKLLEIEKIDQTISKNVVSYIVKMIIGKKTINIHNRVKQKKLSISNEIVNTLSFCLYDRDYQINTDTFIAIDETSTKKIPTIVQNDKSNTETTQREDIIGKQMVGAMEQMGNNPYDQLMAYFDYNKYQFINRGQFQKELQYVHKNEIQPIINKIKEDPTEHKRVRYNYRNNYKVIKFKITASRLAMKENTIIGLYTDHDEVRTKKILPLIFTNKL